MIKSSHCLLDKCLDTGGMHEVLGSAEMQLDLFSFQAVILLGDKVAMAWKHLLKNIV